MSDSAGLARQRDLLRGQIIEAASKAGDGTADEVYTAYMMTVAWATSSMSAAIAGPGATNARRTALGAGALAAGGLGIAAASPLLTGIVAVPSLLAAGYVAKQRRKLKEAERLGEANAQIERLTPEFEQFWDWASRAEDIFERVRKRSRKSMGFLATRSRIQQGKAWNALL
jgi:hypothetical protein